MPDCKAPTKIDKSEIKKAIEFDPFKCPRNADLIIDGNQYQEYVNSLEWLECDFDGDPLEIQEGGIEIGNYKFGNAILPLWSWESSHWLCNPAWVRSRLHMMDERYDVKFTTSIKIPMICSDGTTWMSITPGEIVTQRPGLKYAHGNVLVGGLGLGWFANECCKRKQVNKVTVIEQDADIADYFGNKLKEIHGDKLEIVVGDAYEILKDSDKYNSILYDIWPHISDSEFDDAWVKFICELTEKRPKARWWGWGTPRNSCFSFRK